MENGQRQIELRGGRLVIYTRANDKHGTWHCRFRLNGKLLRRSLKTKDLGDAKRTAEELFEELSYKARTKQPLKTIIFEQVARDYLRKAERLTLEGNLCICRHEK